MKNLKPKFPFSLCKGDHFLRDCPGLIKVLEMWSSASSIFVGHADDTPSTSDVKVGKKKKNVKFPCMLCKGDHYSHLCPHMDEASSLFEKLQLPKGYHDISPNPSLVDGLVNPVPSSISPVDQMVNLVSSLIEPQTQVADLVPSSINPTLHQKSVTQVVDPFLSSFDPTLTLESDTKAVDLFPPVDPILPLENETKVVDSVPPSIDPTPPSKSAKVVDPVPSSVSPTLHLKSAKVVDLIPSSVNPTLPLKSVCAVNLIPPLVDPTLPLESKPDTAHVFLIDTKSTMPGGIPHSPAKPPPSNETILFYWGALTRPHLPSHIPFHITVRVCGRDVPQRLIDEGASVSILSSIAWYTLGCPQLAPVTQNLLAFNRITSQPLGTLPQFPVTLGGKIVFIDVMVVRDPVDFSLLLGRDYVYAMKSIVSTLFHGISFPHDGRIVTINQLSFIGPNRITSLNGSYMQTVSPLPQVNYVALSPMTSTSDDLDPIVDMVISSVGLLEPNLLTPVATLDMCSFQSDYLPSSEDLFESMTEFCPLTWYPSRALFSWKP
jgi:hypothetical protein